MVPEKISHIEAGCRRVTHAPYAKSDKKKQRMDARKKERKNKVIAQKKNGFDFFKKCH